MRHRYISVLGIASVLIISIWIAYTLLPRRGADRLHLAVISFDEISGWAQDDMSGALSAFGKSCEKLLQLPEGAPVAPSAIGGRAGDWTAACQAATELENEAEPGEARLFFETHFQPFRVWSGGRESGLLTGYYEPLIEGSHEQGGAYQVPLYVRPPELVMVDLGAFRADLAGRRIAGLVRNGRLQPYSSHEDIDKGALAGRGLELLWLKDHVDAFFLQIQGSGTVRLPDGEEVKVGFAAQNGHPYTAIGRILVARGDIPLAEISMQSIRRWMAAHPEEGEKLMRDNASYVFFRRLEGGGPVGAQGVELTPERSLAVDRTQLPLGAPIWVDAQRPDEGNPQTATKPLRQLLVAQDTGGAIRGGLRGDVFWGLGERAATIAGHMADHEARFIILLPRPLADRHMKAPGGLVAGGGAD